MWHPDAIERALAHGDKDKVRAAYHRGAHWKERVAMVERPSRSAAQGGGCNSNRATGSMNHPSEPTSPLCIETWQAAVDAATAQFHLSIETGAALSRDDRLCCLINTTIRFALAIAEANDALGISPGKAEIVQLTLEAFHQPSEPCHSTYRARAVAAAYVQGLRSPDSSPKDSRMAAALLLVARLDGLTGDDAAETVRKSIQRLRRKLGGSRLFKFDPDTLTISLTDAEAELFRGLPGKGGRPRRQ